MTKTAQKIKIGDRVYVADNLALLLRIVGWPKGDCESIAKGSTCEK